MRSKASASSINENSLFSTFKGCHDVIIEEQLWSIPSVHIMIVYSPGLCDLKHLNNEVLPMLNRLVENEGISKLQHLENHWHQSTLVAVEDLAEAVTSVFRGQLLLFIKKISKAYVIDISDQPKREPTEPNTEFSIRGPRDGFIEDIGTNVALIRKRLPTENLKYEQFVVGRRGRTKIGLLFIEDIIKPEIVDEIRRRLSLIDVDAILNNNQLEELLSEKTYYYFPLLDYSGRPDYIVDSLLRGRFIVLMDGHPTAMVGPANIMQFLKTSEDMEVSFVYATFERLLRITGLFISAFLPGLWVALNMYHQNQLPFILLANVVQARSGVPLPLVLEAIIMVILFELLREAGARLPVAFGQTLTVVGGLIIGDAAIRAGFTSPSMLVIIATSSVSSFTLINQSLVGLVSTLRLATILICSFLGLYGLFICMFFVLYYLASVRTFGIPFLAPLQSKDLYQAWSAIIRFPWRKVSRRPDFLDTQDKKRKGERNDS